MHLELTKDGQAYRLKAKRIAAGFDQPVDISDPIAILLAIFRDLTLPCEDAADVDDNGRLEIADAVHLLSHLFGGYREPLPPPSGPCGSDPTPDRLRSDGCDAAGPCA